LQLLAGCAPVQRFPARRWDELAASLEGNLLRPGDPAFVARATPWALQYAGVLPGGIAQCTSAADVSTCLQWAQANHAPLVARSGGHSYGGYSTTTGLMIDVSLMNSVAVDEATGLATLGGGARNRNVYAACRPLGRTVTHGRCYDVGVAGLVLGGGIGFNMRAHGLTCDQLVATEIVLADGRILTCSEDENADLFWGLPWRGRRQLRHPHVVHLSDLPGRHLHRLQGDVDGADRRGAGGAANHEPGRAQRPRPQGERHRAKRRGRHGVVDPVARPTGRPPRPGERTAGAGSLPCSSPRRPTSTKPTTGTARSSSPTPATRSTPTSARALRPPPSPTKASRRSWPI
jgi:hypothetical protein